MIKTEKCIRCFELFFPSHGNQKLCPMCQERNYPLNQSICKIYMCKSMVGKHGGRGLCLKHYDKYIKWPREKAKLASKRKGIKVCKTHVDCEVFFKPQSKYHWGTQKYCQNCKKTRKKQSVST